MKRGLRVESHRRTLDAMLSRKREEEGAGVPADANLEEAVRRVLEAQSALLAQLDNEVQPSDVKADAAGVATPSGAAADGGANLAEGEPLAGTHGTDVDPVQAPRSTGNSDGEIVES